MRVKDEDVHPNPTPYSQADPFRLNLKSHHPRKRPMLYIHNPDTVDDMVDELFGDKPRLVPVTAETAKSIEDGCKEMSKTKIGVFPPPVSLKLEPPKHPWTNEFGDYSDGYWESVEFILVSKLVPGFLKEAEVTSISNATHGEYLAEQFEQHVKKYYPEDFKRVEAFSGVFGDALQAWHEDHRDDPDQNE
jgi:hypothetical protein